MSEDHKFVRHKDFDCHLDRSVLCNSFFISNSDWEKPCKLEKDYKKYFPLSEVLAQYVVNPGPKNSLRDVTEQFTQVLDLSPRSINIRKQARRPPKQSLKSSFQKVMLSMKSVSIE
eukprot:GHVP01067213.1.p1 GENE.GHVP01067213.1~~GHVP01067213.1.p1  ORF type:complete len:116 (+),score=7.65 GHVP01067213.1:549-896(+)